LRWVDTAEGVLVTGDRDGNGKADFSILLTGIDTIAKADFLV